MAWIKYDRISHRNCTIANVKFVKSISKRRRIANLYLNNDFWIEAELHLTNDKRYLRCYYSRNLSDKWSKTYNCWATHISVFIKNNKIYSKSKNELREFNNPWLLSRIMKLTFRGKND